MNITSHPSHPFTGRRLVAGSALALMLAVSLGIPSAEAAPSARAAKGGCPASPSTWHLTDLDEWTTRSEAGLVTEFGTLQDAATALLGEGATAGGMTAAVKQTFAFVDANVDGWVCTDDTNPPGIPDYFIHVHDNKFNAKTGGR